MTPALTPAEVRALREGLGVTAEWIAEHLGIQTRTVKRWEAGANAIKPFAVEALLSLESQAADQVAEHVATLRADADLPPLLAIEDGADNASCWPPGWQRMIAFRVRQEIPGLRIVDVAAADVVV